MDQTPLVSYRKLGWIPATSSLASCGPFHATSTGTVTETVKFMSAYVPSSISPPRLQSPNYLLSGLMQDTWLRSELEHSALESGTRAPAATLPLAATPSGTKRITVTAVKRGHQCLITQDRRLGPSSWKVGQNGINIML